MNDLIIIWGTGGAWESFNKSYPNLKIECFVDNNPEKQGKELNGKQVISPDQLEGKKGHIIIVSEFFHEINEQLKSMGFQRGKEYTFYEDYLLRDVDNLIVTYPKCGRTWLRTIIGRILQKKYNLAESSIMDLTDAPIPLEGKVPILLAYHDQHPHLKKSSELSLDANKYKGKRIIFMLRSPHDVIVSLYHHLKFRAGFEIKDKFEFVKEKTDSLITYWNQWYSAMGTFDSFATVTYEGLHRNTVDEVRKVLRAFMNDEEITTSEIEEAIEYSSFDKMRSYEKENHFKHHTLRETDSDNRSLKTRKGKIGGYVDELSDEEIKFIDSRIDQLLDPQVKKYLDEIRSE